MGFRKLAWLIQERLFEGSSSCPTRRVHAAHSGNFSGFNQLAVTCAAAAEKTGPGDAATGKYAMAANKQVEKLTEHAVNVVESVCILQQLGSQSQKSCQADCAS